MKTLGILGGMGPEAAIDLQSKILRHTRAGSDQEHLPVVVWNVPQVPDRTAAILHGAPSPLAAMAAGVKALEQAGAEVIAIACNTAHHWHPELARSVSVPVLHIADACNDAIRRLTPVPSRVALLSTEGTIFSGFYQRRFESLGIPMVLPAQDDQAAVSRGIGLIKAGRHGEALELLLPVVQRLRESGTDAMLLACTELPLVQTGLMAAAPCIDASDSLAQLAVGVCLSQPALKAA